MATGTYCPAELMLRERPCPLRAEPVMGLHPGVLYWQGEYILIYKGYTKVWTLKIIFCFLLLNFLLFSSFSSLFPLLLTFFPPLLKSFPICLEIPPGPGGIRNNMQPWNILIYNGAPGTAGCQRWKEPFAPLLRLVVGERQEWIQAAKNSF